MTRQYLFLDFEFTMPETDKQGKGFFHEIIEVGFVCVQNHQIVNTFTSFVKPVVNPVLNDRCKSFLNISQQDVNAGISFAELVNQFEQYEQSGQSTIVTWGNMDAMVLHKQCRHWGIQYPFHGEEIDLSMEHKRFYGDKNQTGLMKALLEYGHETKGKHHRALDDALNTYEIFKLVEKDKMYLKRSEPVRMGELVDFSVLLGKLA